MIGDNNYLKEVVPYTNNYVTFGDGAKDKIMGKGKQVYVYLPNLEDDLIVEGMNSNLISINQLCDQNLCVNFDCLNELSQSKVRRKS